MFGLFIIITVIFALFGKGDFSYIPLMGALAILVYIVRYRISTKRLSISVHTVNEKTKQAKIHVEMRKPFRLQVQGRIIIVCEHTVSLEEKVLKTTFTLNGQKETVIIPVDWQYCGQMRMKEAQIEFFDAFEMVKYRKDLHVPSAILWPSIQSACFDSAQSYSQLMGNEGGGKERIMPYMPGDPIRSIHWPLSAKLQTFVMQTPGFNKQGKKELALYFNDVKSVEEYDGLMTFYYGILMTEEVANVYIWDGCWSKYSSESMEQVEEFFEHLLSRPLQSLYAPIMPEAGVLVLRREGG